MSNYIKPKLGAELIRGFTEKLVIVRFTMQSRFLVPPREPKIISRNRELKIPVFDWETGKLNLDLKHMCLSLVATIEADSNVQKPLHF